MPAAKHVKTQANTRPATRPRTAAGKGAKKAAAELTAQQRKDAAYAQLAAELLADEAAPKAFRALADDRRVTVRRGGVPDTKNAKCIVYWMQRAERGRDNHALDKAVELGNELGLPVVAYFAGISDFPHANLRHYAFLNRGLQDAERDCHERGVGFVLRNAPHEDKERFFADVGAAMIVGDENPMRVPEQWRVDLAKSLTIPYWTVDADVIVPSKLLEKAQYSGAVARPRIMRLLPEFLAPFMNPKAAHTWRAPHGFERDSPHDDMTRGWHHLDRTVGPIDAWTGGSDEAWRRLGDFVRHKLAKYADDRSHPEKDATSRLSPYLHFGHIGPLTIALAIEKAVADDSALEPARKSYYNEVITWRELSVNFCRYQPEYDSPACADNWARAQIEKHDGDWRETLYTRAQMEHAKTHDELWNAAQIEMVRGGWMPNFLRMYWGKKILEWTPDAAAAMKTAIYLNDKYFLDGRDPNGYSGIAWCMLGKFDRPWPERPVFGKRRYMSLASTGRKFNSKLYIERAGKLPQAPVAAAAGAGKPK